MNEKYDILIIGSGLGGLLCGNILSKNGYKVAIIEKNEIPGGCLQSFKRKRVVFDTGIHYVGSFSEGQRMNKLFNYLGLLEGIKLRQLDTNGFDQFLVGDKEFAYASGHENFVSTLAKSFPGEERNIQHFSDKIREISKSIALYNLEPVPPQNQAFFEKLNYGATSKYLKNLTSDVALRNALSGLNTLYAGKEEGSLLFVHALIYNHYIDSAYRFVDGTHQITNQLIKRLKENGGELFTREEAEKFTFDDKEIRSVVTKTGNEFFAKQFISGIHPQLALKMIPADKLRKAYRKRIENISNTTSAFTLYMVFKDKTVPYMNHNTYVYPSGNVWAGSEYHTDKWPEGFAFYPAADSRDELYTRGASVLTMMNFKEFAPWTDTKVQARGTDYNDFKEQKAQQLITFIKKYLPHIGNNIESYYVSTPLTYRDYIGSPEGAIYGIERDFRKPLESFIFPRTKVPNLLFTGQNVMLHGMLGVSLGSLLTCSELLDINQVVKDINDAG
jgi:all-trans-retinol 13,14-reductase